jgi:hypothetical protein
MPSSGVLAPAYPPPFPSDVKSLRFYETGNATADFGDNEFAFERPDPKDPAEPEQAWANSIRIRAVDVIPASNAELEVSFDGTNVHAIIPANDAKVFEWRHVGGIAVRNAAAAVATFHIEAW